LLRLQAIQAACSCPLASLYRVSTAPPKCCPPSSYHVQVVSAGVDGLAVVSAVFAAADPEAATRELLAAVDAALSTRKSSSSNAPASPHQGSADNIDHSEEDHQRIAACA
jgi:hypothetical protein